MSKTVIHSMLRGTLQSIFRINNVALKVASGVLQVRNNADTADAPIKASALQLSSGAGAGRVLVSDASGNAAWTDGLTLPLAYPKRATMWHKDSLSTSGYAVSELAAAAQFTGFLYHQSPAVNGDKWTNGFFLAAGSYTLHFLSARSSGSGRLDIKIDGSAWGTVDFYNATTVYNQDLYGNLTAATDGWHTLEGTVNGKNASSSGYVINVTCITVVPTAD